LAKTLPNFRVSMGWKNFEGSHFGPKLFSSRKVSKMGGPHERSSTFEKSLWGKRGRRHKPIPGAEIRERLRGQRGYKFGGPTWGRAMLNRGRVCTQEGRV